MKVFFGKKCVFFIYFLASVLIFSGYSAYQNQEAISNFLRESAAVSDPGQLQALCSDFADELQEKSKSNAFTEVYGMAQKFLGKQEFRNFTYIKGAAGMIYYGNIIENRNDMLMEYAKRVGRAAQCAREQGAETVFIMPPSKVLYDVMGEDKKLPVNDTNAVQDELLLYLQQNRVSTLDLRTALAESGMTQEELFYRTDRLWTSEAAFVAAGAVVDKIRNDFGDDWDPDHYYCNRENYTADIYYQATVGESGRETGIIYAGKEDYTVLYPRFETDMKWCDLEDGKEKKGDFSEAFITLKQDRKGEYSNPGSAIYLEGVADRDCIINEANPDGPRILCLRDVYMSPVACFLAPVCSRIDLVWARSNHNQIDYEQLIRDGGYDYLLIETYPYNIEDTAFEYFKDEQEKG